MKNILKEYKGACLFYLLIILAVFVVSVNNNHVNNKYEGVPSYKQAVIN